MRLAARGKDGPSDFDLGTRIGGLEQQVGTLTGWTSSLDKKVDGLAEGQAGMRLEMQMLPGVIQAHMSSQIQTAVSAGIQQGIAEAYRRGNGKSWLAQHWQPLLAAALFIGALAYAAVTGAVPQ